MLFCFYKYDFKINEYDTIYQNHEFFEKKTHNNNDNNFNSFHRMSINTLNYATMGGLCCLLLLFYQ